MNVNYRDEIFREGGELEIERERKRAREGERERENCVFVCVILTGDNWKGFGNTHSQPKYIQGVHTSA